MTDCSRNQPGMAAEAHTGRGRGFTLIEVLVVIGIIVLLVSILLPVVSRVKTRAQVATVQAQINGIDAAIQAYAQAFGGALPGPIPSGQLGPTPSPALTLTVKGGGTIATVTGSENLVLGLLGGLQPTTGGGGVEFDPGIVGRGPRGLKLTNPKSNNAFIDGVPLTPPAFEGSNAPAGEFVDAAGDAADSVIPEIVDRFGEPLPILYLRATKGAAGVISDQTAQTIPGPSGQVVAQYHLQDIIGYTEAATGSIGVGKSIGLKEYTTAPTNGRPHGLRQVTETKTLDKSDANYEYPFDAFPYFQNRSIPAAPGANLNYRSTPHNKDGFILISAGADRVYGTRDDITNFGSLAE